MVKFISVKSKPGNMAKSTGAKAKSTDSKKIFVLDTSVILYNHNAINEFDDNDVAIPITVLEELDNFKKETTPKTLKPGSLSGFSTGFLVSPP